MTFLLPFLLRLAPYLIASAVLLGGAWALWHRVTHWCNTVCVQQTHRADAAEKLLDDARKRATALALAWAAEVDKTEAKNREAEKERAEKFAALAKRPVPDRPVSISPELDSVWRDSSRQANAAGSPPVGQETAPAVSGSTYSDKQISPTYSETQLAEFFVASAAAYADAYGQWQACVNHYTQLREKS